MSKAITGRTHGKKLREVWKRRKEGEPAKPEDYIGDISSAAKYDTGWVSIPDIPVVDVKSPYRYLEMQLTHGLGTSNVLIEVAGKSTSRVGTEHQFVLPSEEVVKEVRDNQVTLDNKKIVSSGAHSIRVIVASLETDAKKVRAEKGTTPFLDAMEDLANVDLCDRPNGVV